MWNMDYGLKKSTAAPRFENEIIIPTRLFAFIVSDLGKL